MKGIALRVAHKDPVPKPINAKNCCDGALGFDCELGHLTIDEVGARGIGDRRNRHGDIFNGSRDKDCRELAFPVEPPAEV